MYKLIFKGYRQDETIIDTVHLFSSLRDLHAHAAWLLDFTNPNDACDRYDIRVEFVKGDQVSLAA